MTRIRLAYIHRFRDRHGKARHYVRRTGFKPVPLPGQPGTEEFMAAYAAAMNGETAVRLEVGASRTAAGTVNAAIASYYSSAAFLALATETQGNRRAILERFREEHGDKRIAMLEQRHLMAMLAVKKPHAAKNWLKALRGLLQHAVAAHLRLTIPRRASSLPGGSGPTASPPGPRSTLRLSGRATCSERARGSRLSFWPAPANGAAT
jgi:hypothetical protein